MIDTPGHVDFNWEVARSLTACDGVILVVDATQGIQAQTMSNFYLAFELGLAIVPVLNKTDLPTADAEQCREELMDTFDIEPDQCIEISAKSGLNVNTVLDAIVNHIPPPTSFTPDYTAAWCFDADVGEFIGNRFFVRNIGAVPLKRNVKIATLGEGKTYTVRNVGVCCPEPKPVEQLEPGQIGFLIVSCENPSLLLGKTLAAAGDKKHMTTEYRQLKTLKPTVFASFFPEKPNKLRMMETALKGLVLNDPVVTLQPANSASFGAGYKVGFLGSLHMEVFTQRLNDEFDTNVIISPPMVNYRAQLKDSVNDESLVKIRQLGLTVFDDENGVAVVEFAQPNKYLPAQYTDQYLEQFVELTLMVPVDYWSGLEKHLVEKRRAEFVSAEYLGNNRLIVVMHMPLAESITSFHHEIKKISSGFASYDTVELDWRPTSISCLGVTVHDSMVPELHMIVQDEEAEQLGREMVKDLAQSLPLQDFPVRVAGHLTKDPHAKSFGKAFCSAKTRYRRKDTTKAKGSKSVDLFRQGKLKKREKDRVDDLRLVGRVNVPHGTVMSVIERHIQ